MNSSFSSKSFSRRRLIGTTLGAAAGLSLAPALAEGTATPESSSSAEWTYTDVLGKTVTLPNPPVRIAANLVTAAALWDLGIKSVAVFDYTATAYPDGDHVAWGNIDPKAVVNVGDVDGNILPEDLIAAEPDIILTLTFATGNPDETAGVPPSLADAIEQIAPVLVVTDMESTEIQLGRLVDVAESLGADLSTPEIVEAKSTYEAKLEEFQSTTAEKSDLTTLFINFDAAELYIAGPRGVADLQFLSSLGLNFANAESEAAGDFWETLSSEQALKYPVDVIFNDVYSTYKTVEELQETPVYSAMAAIEAGQVGLWIRDFPVNYGGITDFLENILTTLRTAEKVS